MDDFLKFQADSIFAEADKQRALDKQRDYYVVKHNDLIQKQTFQVSKKNVGSMSATEQKIFLYIISKIKPFEYQSRDIKFDIKTFCKVVGINDKGNNYIHLKNSIENLMSRVIYIEDEEKTTMLNLISETEINKNSGQVIIKLHKKIEPYLLNLYNNYTQYSLMNVLAFKCKYSFILYELLKSYQFKKRWNIISYSIEDIKEKLDCANYTNFSNFIKRVIEPSISEINNYTDLEVEANLIKDGRTYTTIEFKVKQLKFDLDEKDYIKRISRTQREIEPNKKTFYETFYGEIDDE